MLETCCALFEPIESAAVLRRRRGNGHPDSWSRALAALCVSCALGCESTAPRPVGPPSISASMVTGDALAALDDQGHYRTKVAPIPTGFPTLSGARAREIIDQLWPGWSVNLTALLEEDRGGPLDPARLRSCGPPQYAESPYDQTPDPSATITRIIVGPQWIVGMCDGESVKAIFSVGALAVALDVPDPHYAPPETQLNGIQYVGVPDGVTFATSAEQATIAVAQATGAKVARVPYSIRGEFNLSPWYAAWSVQLDRKVNVLRQTTGRTDSLDHVFYGSMPDYGVRPGPRWPLAMLADIAAGGRPATQLVGDHYVTTSAGDSLVSVTYNRRSFPSFFIVEKVLKAP